MRTMKALAFVLCVQGLLSADAADHAIPPHQPLNLVGLHAYAEKSVAAGETIRFRASSTEPYQLSICRLGPKIDDPAGDEVLATFPESPAVRQPIHPGSYVLAEKPLAADQDLPSLTLECWVRLFGQGTWQTLLSQHDYPKSCGYGLFVTPDNRLAFYLGDGAEYRQSWAHPGPKLTPRRWYHVVATWDGKNKALWVDGSKVDQWEHTAPVRAGRGDLRLGACGALGRATNFLDGDLATPVVYDRCLSAEEIHKRHAEQGLAPAKGQGVLACWPLAEERGARVADQSGQDRHGRIINLGTWMIGGPTFDATKVPPYAPYDPAKDPQRGHALRLASDDLFDCRWKVTHEYRVPATARPGIYVGRFRFTQEEKPRLYDVTFIVKRAQDRPKAPLLVLASSNTWLAYNSTPFAATPPELLRNWGTAGGTNSAGNPPAYSCYRDHRPGQPTYQVGVNVPWPNAGPYVLYSQPQVAYSHLMRAERFALTWLEQSGYAYDMLSELDLEKNPGGLAGYKAVLVNGHSEYWSRRGFEAVDRYLRAGGSLAVLSGNSVFWRVSFNEEGTVMECRKAAGLPGGRRYAHTGELWHSQDGQRGSLLRECGLPSWKLIGLDTLGFAGTAATQFGLYHVRQADHFLFHKPKEVGVPAGATFGGAPGGGLPQAVGHEWDVRASRLRDLSPRVPDGAALPQDPPGIATLAEGIVASSVRFDYFMRPLPASPNAVVCDMIYWERPEGGRVFNAGSVGAGWGLSADPKFQILFGNVLHHFGVVPTQAPSAAAPSLPKKSGGEPPQLLYLGSKLHPTEPPKAPPAYVKKSTWHESMRASLEAAFGPTLAKDRAARADGFRPAIVKLSADGKPVKLALRVAGLERLCFATLGRLPENGSAHFLSPRLFDKQGNAVALDLGSPMLEGKADGRAARTAASKIDGTEHRGFAISPGEISFKLDGKYERLEVLVCYVPQGGLPPYAAVDSRPLFARATECREIRQSLWDQVGRDFPDRQSQIEMEMERRDGIWNEYAPSGSEASNAYYLARAQDRLALARKTLEFVERSAARPQMAAELKALAQRIDVAAKARSSTPGRDLFAQAVDLRRRIIFSHPALGFDRLLVSKRPPPVLSAPGDNYFGMHNGTGPGLVILDQWKSDRPKESVLLSGKLPPGCAMHADVSFDGQRIVFAYADHTPPRDRWQFFLYEIRVDGTGLRQITGRSDDPLAGAGGRTTVLCEDYDPCYLPDGGIAFISTRNQGGVRCHNGDRYCPTYLLYRCNADGSHVRQISFNEASEWDPTVMPDGRIIWMRWDYINRPVIPTFGFWTARPDGTAASHYFGNYTPNPCRICQPRPIPGSRKIVATTAGHHTIHAGSLILIDRQIAEDGLDAITRLTPEATFPESEPHSAVSFGSPYPLSEDLFLAEFCPEPYPASMARYPRPSAYGIYLVDTLGGRELIYRDPEISCFEPLPIQTRPTPPVLPPTLAAKGSPATGVFYLQDVYRSTQGIPRGTIRQLRVNQIIPQPTQRVPYSSAVRFEVLKRVLGTVPVDESGSVAFVAPAGVALQFQALDEHGMAVMTMRSSAYLQPGEQAGCVGCHESRNSSPLARSSPGVAPVVLKLQPPFGPQYEGGLSFAKTVQPVLDRYCIRCHGLQETAGKIDLLGTIDATEANIANTFRQLLPSNAYAALTRDGRLVKIAQYGGETWYSEPKDYFAHGGTLAGLLLKVHEGVELDRESRQRIFDWLDLNAQFYGTYSWNKDEWRRPDPEGERALRAHIRQRFGDELAGQPFAALVNVALPEESRILKAPLALAGGGWGQIERAGWRSRDDPEYRAMRRLVDAAIQPLPYSDIAGTCGRGDETCRCLSCWVRKIMEQRQGRIAAAR